MPMIHPQYTEIIEPARFIEPVVEVFEPVVEIIEPIHHPHFVPPPPVIYDIWLDNDKDDADADGEGADGEGEEEEEEEPLKEVPITLLEEEAAADEAAARSLAM